MIGTVLAWAAKQFFGEYFKKSGASAFDRSSRLFSRGMKFRRRLVRQYAEAVTQDFAQHSMGFATDKVVDIENKYVPLQYEVDGERQDVYKTIRERPCSVVIGPAGAGKSLLLKHSMLLWAKRAKAGRAERVPILIELHRCNSTSETLVDLIVSELARARVNKTGQLNRIRELVLQGLRDGALSLLFDGLDEVARADHSRVFSALRDFTREYDGCQFIVTCRDVVYQGQPLGPKFSHVVRIAELDDAGVIRLLGNWRSATDTIATAEIFSSLRKNPELMRLARSPLLLTMIAYLQREVFSKTGRRLPTSRPAFYQEAITHLLGRDADLGRTSSLTLYEVGEKLAVLQRVALASMENSTNRGDRLAISRINLEMTTKGLLPDLNLDHTHIKNLLDEIIDRSQLLVAIDKRKSNYVFRHLTLQEYLAATELADDSDGLLKRYRSEPLAWRETVKLWCGANARDSTKVISEIFNSDEMHHKILALECLAEARRVDSKFAKMVINYFILRLGSVGPDRAAVLAALGSVAADNRPRGQELMQVLTAIATTESPAKVDAMQALSASGRPEAAEVLAPHNAEDEDRRAALRGMGELALPALTARAAEGRPWAVDDLAIVGTPAAAVSLVELIWQDNSSATRAAWRLADLIRNPNVEDELRRLPRPNINSIAESWVWQPFASSGKDNALPLIAGRVFMLLKLSRVSEIPEDIHLIDPRLAIPLILESLRSVELSIDEIQGSQGPIKALMSDILKDSSTLINPLSARRHIRAIFMDAAKRTSSEATLEHLIESISSACNLAEVNRRQLELISWPVRATIYGSVLTQKRTGISGRIRRGDWSTVLMPRRNTSRLWQIFGWTVGSVIVCVALTGIFRSIVTVTNIWPLGPKWLSYALLSGVLCFAGFFLAMEKENLQWLAMAFFMTTALSIEILWFFGIGTINELSFWRLPAFAGLAILLIFGTVSGLVGRRRARVNDNPFRCCLEADAIRLNDRISVIAS